MVDKMKTTTKVMIWSRRSFLVSIVLFVGAFSLMLMQNYDSVAYNILTIMSRFILISIAISFVVFSFSGLLILDYKKMYLKITNLKNKTKLAFQQITANDSAKKTTKLLFLLSILVLTVLQKILFFIFVDGASDNNDIKDGHNPTDHEKSNPLSDDYDHSYFSDRSWDFGFSDDV